MVGGESVSASECNPEGLTAAERRIKRLLDQGYRPESSRQLQRTRALLPPGKANSWDGGSVWVRQTTLNNLKRKLAAQ